LDKSPKNRTPCPTCGSNKVRADTPAAGPLGLRIGVSVAVKNPGKKRMRVQATPDFNRDHGKLVHVNRIVEPETDRYFERVTDYETGEVTHESEISLSQKKIEQAIARKKKKPDG
jgi:hypothetical protein